MVASLPILPIIVFCQHYPVCLVCISLTICPLHTAQIFLVYCLSYQVISVISALYLGLPDTRYLVVGQQLSLD